MRGLVLVSALGLALTMANLTPFPERVARARAIVVGHYAFFGLAGVRDSVAIETILIDRRASPSRAESALHGLAYLSQEELHRRTNSFRNEFLFWYGEGPRPELWGSSSAALPTTVEECDRLLDQLSDSLETSHNPNFGAVARYLIAQRPRLPLAGNHASRKVFARP